MAGYTLSALEADIRSYTEVSSTVLTGAILSRFIENAEYRVMRDCPIDADRKAQTGNLVTGHNTLNVPGSGSKGNTGTVFVRGIEVFESTANSEGEGTWLQKKDQTYLSEYVNRLTGTEGGSTGQDVTGFPKYYAMFGGATATTDTTSGRMMVAPVPDANYAFKVHFNAKPTSLVTDTSGTYISQYFPSGLLYASLIEAMAF